MAGTGETRRAPSTVPRISAPTPPMRNSSMLVQKNWTKRSALSVSTETNSLIRVSLGEAGGQRSVVAGPGSGSRTGRARSVLLELRRLRRGAGLAQRAVVDLPPRAVRE